jgi:hypothetical protein
MFADKRMELGAHLRKMTMGYFTEGNIGKIQLGALHRHGVIEENCMTRAVAEIDELCLFPGHPAVVFVLL